MNAEPRRRVSYLLRLWQTQSDGRAVWRASLEDPYSGRRRGFAGLPELLAYLEQEIACVDREERQSVECSERTQSHRCHGVGLPEAQKNEAGAK